MAVQTEQKMGQFKYGPMPSKFYENNIRFKLIRMTNGAWYKGSYDISRQCRCGPGV